MSRLPSIPSIELPETFSAGRFDLDCGTPYGRNPWGDVTGEEWMLEFQCMPGQVVYLHGEELRRPTSPLLKRSSPSPSDMYATYSSTESIAGACKTFVSHSRSSTNTIGLLKSHVNACQKRARSMRLLVRNIEFCVRNRGGMKHCPGKWPSMRLFQRASTAPRRNTRRPSTSAPVGGIGWHRQPAGRRDHISVRHRHDAGLRS